jgi:hypothetical protein
MYTLYQEAEGTSSALLASMLRPIFTQQSYPECVFEYLAMVLPQGLPELILQQIRTLHPHAPDAPVHLGQSMFSCYARGRGRETERGLGTGSALGGLQLDEPGPVDHGGVAEPPAAGWRQERRRERGERKETYACAGWCPVTVERKNQNQLTKKHRSEQDPVASADHIDASCVCSHASPSYCRSSVSPAFTASFGWTNAEMLAGLARESLLHVRQFKPLSSWMVLHRFDVRRWKLMLECAARGVINATKVKWGQPISLEESRCVSDAPPQQVPIEERIRHKRGDTQLRSPRTCAPIFRLRPRRRRVIRWSALDTGTSPSGARARPHAPRGGVQTRTVGLLPASYQSQRTELRPNRCNRIGESCTACAC